MKVVRSSEKITFDKVNNDSMANIEEIVMDKEFVKQSRHDWCWLSNKNVPEEVGWYKIDRENCRLAKTKFEEAARLEWHERIYVYGSALAAVHEQMPLALYIGDEYSDGRLTALYLCGPDVLTWVATKVDTSNAHSGDNWLEVRSKARCRPNDC
jgi:hypothetical protein